MSRFRLHVYGGENIEETENFFETLPGAIEEAESRSTDHTQGWEIGDGKLSMTDLNLVGFPAEPQGEDIVFHTIEEVEDDE